MQAISDDKTSEISSPRSKSQTLRAIAEINSKTTEKERKRCKVEYGVTTTDNPLLDLPIDLHL